MTEADVLAWLRDLQARGGLIPELNTFYLQAQPAAAWLAEAHSALRAALPSHHALLRDWDAVFERAKSYKTPMFGEGKMSLTDLHYKTHFAGARGVIDAAVALVQGGRLRTLADGIRADTVAEVLDQASLLLGASLTVAAAVLAGGALETHLLHLCDRNGLTWSGDGSIAKYDQAVAQARNAGTVEVYPATDSKLIGGWGGLRNDAAHDPTDFRRSVDEVGLMVEGITQFIARVP